MIFLQGFLTGLGMVIFIGPVFFYLLQSSIAYHWKAGLSIAVGIIVGDILISFAILKGFDFNYTSPILKPLLGTLFFCIGLYYLLSKSSIKALELRNLSYFSFFIKGFSINFFNPFVFGVWFGLIEFQKLSIGIEKTSLFLSSVLLGIFITDVSKVFFAQYLQQFAKERYLNILKRITGLVFMLFSLKVVYSIF